MRTMNTEKLLKTIPIIQNQMDALLDFNVSLRLNLKCIIALWSISVLGKSAEKAFRLVNVFSQVNANELTNGVINAAFMLLFKDSIRLFAAYNEGIINLLGRVFARRLSSSACLLHVLSWLLSLSDPNREIL